MSLLMLFLYHFIAFLNWWVIFYLVQVRTYTRKMCWTPVFLPKATTKIKVFGFKPSDRIRKSLRKQHRDYRVVVLVHTHWINGWKRPVQVAYSAILAPHAVAHPTLEDILWSVCLYVWCVCLTGWHVRQAKLWLTKGPLGWAGRGGGRIIFLRDWLHSWQ